MPIVSQNETERKQTQNETDKRNHAGRPINHQFDIEIDIVVKKIE
jgi:hypothetical protein